MKIQPVWILVDDDTNEPVVPIDEFADGMLFLTEERAQQAAEHHKQLYDVACHAEPLTTN